MKKVSLFAVFAAAAAFITAIILMPDAASGGAAKGLTICGEVIIPSLFPLTVMAGFLLLSGAADALSPLIGHMFGRLLRLPDKACVCIILSFISGYPVGGTMVRRLYDSGDIGRDAAERMLAYSVNAGPAMIILVVGKGLFGSTRAGALLYAVHIAASLIIGAALALFEPMPAVRTRRQNVNIGMADAFVTSVCDACTAMLNICGTVVLFSCISAIATELIGSRACYFTAALEVTNGCIALAPLGMPIVSALLGFGGLSVICQVLTVTRGLISLPRMLICRICHGALSFLLCSAAMPLLRESVLAVSTGTATSSYAWSFSPQASCAMMLFGGVTLFYCTFRRKGFTLRSEI